VFWEEERAVILSAAAMLYAETFREADIFDAMHKHIGVRLHL
jgi:hypothetical protein